MKERRRKIARNSKEECTVREKEEDEYERRSEELIKEKKWNGKR